MNIMFLESLRCFFNKHNLSKEEKKLVRLLSKSSIIKVSGSVDNITSLDNQDINENTVKIESEDLIRKIKLLRQIGEEVFFDLDQNIQTLRTKKLVSQSHGNSMSTTPRSNPDADTNYDSDDELMFKMDL